MQVEDELNAGSVSNDDEEANEESTMDTSVKNGKIALYAMKFMLTAVLNFGLKPKLFGQNEESKMVLKLLQLLSPPSLNLLPFYSLHLSIS